MMLGVPVNVVDYAVGQGYDGHARTVGTRFAAMELSERELLIPCDPIEDVLAPTVTERSFSTVGCFKDRARIGLVQARKALTPHVFHLDLLWTNR